MLSSDLLASVLHSAPDAIVIVDEGGCIAFASEQVSVVLGYEPRELVGQSIEKLVPERFHAVHAAHRARYRAEALARPMGINLELHALRKDGTELPVEISLSPVIDGARQLVAAAIRDVSERRRIQTELQLAREAAERANQAKSRFLATASHDLRQPLQTLSLLNGTLRRMVSEPTAVAAVAQQEQAIDAMSRLLNALLDISKLESGAIRPDPTDFTVAALFEQLRTEFAALAASKGLELRVEPAAVSVYSDPSLVGQILRNLVSNAIKYTGRGWVRLRALASPQSVQIEVGDSGVGMAPDQLPYIYDEFYQIGVGSNTTREGYGLGLSIVQRLVRLLDLKLEVRSAPGAGSVFTLELPAGSTMASATGAPPSVAVAKPNVGGAPRVLLVDDDAGVRKATAMLLKVEGFEVVPAGSLAEAVEQLTANPRIDLLVTDYHLQQGDTGLDVIVRARAVAGPGLNAVLITGDTSATVRDLPPDPGIRIASKPIRADELIGLMKSLLPV